LGLGDHTIMASPFSGTKESGVAGPVLEISFSIVNEVAPITAAPITAPTPSPSKAPTTDSPSASPSKVPTKAPTTPSPSKAPSTPSPSKAPTTDSPSASPSNVPTKSPTTPAPVPPAPISPACDLPYTGPDYTITRDGFQATETIDTSCFVGNIIISMTIR